MTSKGMEKMTQSNIGVDISKDHLDVHRLPEGAGCRFPNTKAGFRALLVWLGPVRVARIVYEPTGPYHRAFEAALADAGMPLVKVNPRQARRFAEATGQLAKTDRTDAVVLARFGVALQPQPRPIASALLDQLRQLHMARPALVKDRTAARNRENILALPLLRRQNSQRLAQIQMAAIEEAMAKLIAQDGALAQRLAILKTIPGIATVSAMTLLIEMPELGTLTGKQAASLAGLTPTTRQSGTWTGHAFIRGGRASLRQAL
jgi:transposase